MSYPERDPDSSSPPAAAAPWLGVGVGVGVALGASIGAALDNVALGIGIGIALGAGLGGGVFAAIVERGRSRPDDDA